MKDAFAKGLMCATLDPGLRSMLIFDSNPAALYGFAEQLRVLLCARDGYAVDIVLLGSTEAEDDLWGTFVPHASGTLSWEPGRLVQPEHCTGVRIVLIPDLTRLSLPVARACVTLMGADVATLQRHSRQAVWSPNLCWLAGCARSEVGEVSPHLLDRFALRLTAHPSPLTDRAAAIRDWAMAKGTARDAAAGIFTEELLQQLWHAEVTDIVVSPPALARAMAYFRPAALQSVRRELALARLGRALAQLDSVPVVDPAHIDAAAALIGLAMPVLETSTSADAPLSQSPSPMSTASGQHQTSGAVLDTPLGSNPSDDTPAEEPVLEPDTETQLTTPALSLPPYPEDTALVTRTIDSLRLPPQRHRAAMATEGVAIGTQRARSLSDIAWVSTILEAAKYQKLRGPGHYMLRRADLRSYRRAPVPQRTIVLVMDYTCLRGCDWQQALLPHLTWAYVERASVCIVQVGSSQATNRYRASQLVARGLLAPHMSPALTEQPGTATPLAHGLALAARRLRIALQHGRSHITQARLVVLSDGRGNVPLAASHAGELTQPVAREGIDDAFRIASDIKVLNNIDAYVLSPQPQQYADLPLLLAEALGAKTVNIPVPRLGARW